MKRIIGIIIVVVLALYGLSRINNQIETEPLPRNDLQETVAYTENEELDNGQYIIDTGDSYLGWKGETALTKHYGTVYLSDTGTVTITDGKISGDITFDMNTIKSEIGLGLDDHLKNEDFFDVTKYPEARIAITDYVNGEIQGDLVIKDISQPVSLPVTLKQDENTLTMNGFFSLDRTLWEIEYNSASFIDGLGDKAINDLIDFEVEFILNKNNE